MEEVVSFLKKELKQFTKRNYDGSNSPKREACSTMFSAFFSYHMELKINIRQESIHTYTMYPSGFDPP